MEIATGYEPVARVLQEALDQCQHGKGKERHANDKPFLQQRMMTIARDTGAGGLAYQVCKKTQEALDLPTLEMKKRELLGAIVYLCGQVLLEEENGKKHPIVTFGGSDMTQEALREAKEAIRKMDAGYPQYLWKDIDATEPPEVPPYYDTCARCGHRTHPAQTHNHQCQPKGE